MAKITRVNQPNEWNSKKTVVIYKQSEETHIPCGAQDLKCKRLKRAFRTGLNVKILKNTLHAN
jgi:hypothetical protein